MSFLINRSFRTLSAIHRAPRLRIGRQIQCCLFSDDVKTPTTETTAAADDHDQPDSTEQNDKLGSFARAHDKYTKIVDAKPEKPVAESLPFAKLLRQSKFIDLGDPSGKIVSGKIVHTVNDDLYIDFGSKFQCICVRPERDGRDYVVGAVVRLRINDLELSYRFLGAVRDLTILEADCTLMGLISSPRRQSNRKETRAQQM